MAGNCDLVLQLTAIVLDYLFRAYVDRVACYKHLGQSSCSGLNERKSEDFLAVSLHPPRWPYLVTDMAADHQQLLVQLMPEGHSTYELIPINEPEDGRWDHPLGQFGPIGL